ncbi:MAG: sensor histidine kinase [Eubacteriales bacterium]|nr:sensor histidine kinase [Eubacteriales bacterium]
MLLSFLLFSILPVLVLTFYSYGRIATVVQDNIDQLIDNNMAMISRNLDITLSSYSDILTQLYTSDEVVSLVDDISNDKDVALHRNQLLRTLRAACYFRPYIQGITILLPNGGTVFYDKLTGSATHTAWLTLYPVGETDILASVSADNQMHVLPTAFAAFINSESEYVFHLAHRIIDYRYIYKQCGVIILSIDSDLLMETIDYDAANSNGENILLDGNGVVLASAHGDQIGKTYQDVEAESLAVAKLEMDGNLHLYRYTNAEYGWQIIRVLDQSAMRERILSQQSWFLTALLVASGALLAAVIIFTGRMTSSIRSIVLAMGNAGRGDMDTRLALPGNAPNEIRLIANDFNRMMGEIGDMMVEVRQANDRQRQAELTAVEAQLNPHFLYNTLDTINWMAIDREQYEISNCISALGGILRYAIDRSNLRVKVRDELNWVEKYVFLQRTRLKNEFTFAANVEPQTLECWVHKLLFQPYIENAIIHGFEGVKGPCALGLSITIEAETLLIIISDNGKGMNEQAIQDAFGTPPVVQEGERTHIGIRNAMTRLDMYYGGRASVVVHSSPGCGTTVTLRVPIDGEGGNPPCAL